MRQRSPPCCEVVRGRHSAQLAISTATAACRLVLGLVFIAAAHSPAAIEHGLAVGLVRDMALTVLAAAAWMLARRPSQPPASEPAAHGGGVAEPQA